MCSQQHCASALGCARQTDRYLHSTARVRYHDRERELYTRDTSDDLFISELWRLLDDYEVLKPQAFFLIHWPGVKKAGKDKANGIKPWKQTKQQRKRKISWTIFLPPCMFWLLLIFPEQCDQFIWVRSSQFASLFYLYLKMWHGNEKFESVCKSQLEAFLHSRPLANIFLFLKV